ncbi:MAG TPA: class I SAM-dependent methyltransferase [Steroidobacteraceae bacterium]|jgi:SAM-dependent methyltransferase
MSDPAFKDHFSALAGQYSAFRPTYPAQLADYVRGLCAAQGMAWDCACGSGQATVGLAERFDRVIATDASAKQLAQAPAIANVEYRVARAEDSGLETNSADLIVVAQSAHWFDLPAFYAEADRVLKAGGILSLWTYGNLTVEGEEVDDLVRRFYSETVGPYWPPERKWVEDGYRTLSFPYADIRAPSFDVEARWSLPELLGYMRSWSATGGYVRQHGVDPVAAVAGPLESTWKDPQRQRLVRWPMALRTGRKPALS